MTNRQIVNQRRNRVKRNTTSLEKTRLETKIHQEELENGLLLVDKIQKDRMRMISEIEKELALQHELKEKIQYLKGQFKILKTGFEANSKILNNMKSQRQIMQSEVSSLENTIAKHKLQDQSQPVISNNYAKLMDSVNSERNGNPKEKSVLLSILRDLIQTTHENEFEGYSWKAKVAHAEKSVKARIRFSNLAIHESNLKEIYLPVIKATQSKFKRQNISISTKSHKENGIVSVLDMTVTVPFQIKEREVELP